MINFHQKIRNPGDPIRSEEWNEIQNDIKKDLVELENKLIELQESITKITETIVITNLESSVGRSYRLTDPIFEEYESFKLDSIGLISKQWVTNSPGVGEICSFGIVDNFDVIYYWATADNGDKESLTIEFEYVGGRYDTDSQTDDSIKEFKDLFVNEKIRLTSKNPNNPWEEYLYSDSGIWYKYKLVNPYPQREVSYIRFTNTNPDTITRIGNVVQIKKRTKMLDEYVI